MTFVEGEYDRRAVSQNGFGSVSYGSDEGLFVEFRLEPVYQEAESLTQGHPVYKDVEYIRIYFPGDRTKVTDTAVTDEHRARFARKYEAFRLNEEAPQVGLALKLWPPLSKSQVAELNAAKIHTVEQLAGLPDTALVSFGWRALRDQAKSYVSATKGGDEVARLTVENAKLVEAVERLNRQVEQLMESKESETDAPRRGRPRKEVA